VLPRWTPSSSPKANDFVRDVWARPAPVTFLFTEIEGFDAPVQSSPSSCGPGFSGTRRLLREYREAARNFVQHTGDGNSPALRSAVIRGRPPPSMRTIAWRNSAVPGRMGLHSGEGELRDGRLLRPSVNRCARLMAVGSRDRSCCRRRRPHSFRQAKLAATFEAIHFSVRRTLLEAWAGRTRASNPRRLRDPVPGRRAATSRVDFRGEKRSNQTHALSTDSEACWPQVRRHPGHGSATRGTC